MPIAEFDEPFAMDAFEIQGIVTEYGGDAPAGEPGMVTEIIRLLLDDKDAALIPAGAILTRINTGAVYRVKTPRKAGVGLTEFDLGLMIGIPFERNF